MSQCINGGCTKEGKQCPVCGGGVPPSLGCKPRKYCSSECLHKAHHHRLRGPSECADCKCPITQPPGKGRKRVVCGECKAARRLVAMPAVCVSCGSPFRSSSRIAMFCSDECRWARRPGMTTCAGCEKPFRQRSTRQKCCSRECGGRVGRQTRSLSRKTYQCLHCGRPFHRRPFRTANKYCGRDCAFEAKRVQSRRCAYSQLVAWFHNWSADALPPPPSPPMCTNHKSRCQRFGVPYEAIDRESVFRAAGWTCAICGCEMLREYTVAAGRLDQRSPTIDCIIPLSAGPGSPGYVYGNVQACCHACNVKKSDSFASPKPTSLD